MTAKNTHQGRRRRVAPAYLKRKGSIGKDSERGPDRAITLAVIAVVGWIGRAS